MPPTSPQGASQLALEQATQETEVRSLRQEDPLEEDMAAHSSVLTWRIPWTEEPGGLQSMGSQRVGHSQASKRVYTHTHTHTHTRPPSSPPGSSPGIKGSI